MYPGNKRLDDSNFMSSPEFLEGEEAFSSFSQKPQPFPINVATVYMKMQKMRVLRPVLPLRLLRTGLEKYYSQQLLLQ